MKVYLEIRDLFTCSIVMVAPEAGGNGFFHKIAAGTHIIPVRNAKKHNAAA